tara:strand:+ start:302 stop:661 length:360 start_codon:yes stop_codon:yes gene_type:complete
MKITKARLKEIIKEELESLNPEWDKASKIQSDIVRLADELLASENADWVMTLGDRGIVQALRSQVEWLEKRLAEKFTPEEPEDEISDEETLVLPRLDYDPLSLDDPRAEKMRKIARGNR